MKMGYSHHSSYGMVSDICHSNLVNISGVSINFPTVDYIYYDCQRCIREEDKKGIIASPLRSKQTLMIEWADVISSPLPVLQVLCHWHSWLDVYSNMYSWVQDSSYKDWIYFLWTKMWNTKRFGSISVSCSMVPPILLQLLSRDPSEQLCDHCGRHQDAAKTFGVSHFGSEKVNSIFIVMML